MADNFSHNYSSALSTNTFTSACKKAEKHTINFSFDNAEVYNRPFSIEELQDALRRAHDTSAEPDEIHYQLLKHILQLSLLLFSCVYLLLTPNSQSVFRSGVPLNIHLFILLLLYILIKSGFLVNPIHKPHKDPIKEERIFLYNDVLNTFLFMVIWHC